jgi:MSHA biogenesis protein MshI
VAVATEANVRAVVADASSSERPRILAFAEQSLEPDSKSLRSAFKSLRIGSVTNGMTVLAPSDYQFIVVEKPDVPPAELQSAMKWKLKDIAGMAPDAFSFDLLAIPGADGEAANARSMYAVIAPNDKLKRQVRKLDEARFGLSVIDIPETAQRNIATLFEQPDRGTAFLFFDDAGGLLTISYRAELYHARRVELKYSDLLAAGGEARTELLDRVVLELQRTLDHFERQFSFIPLNRILLGPEPGDSGMLAYLKSNLSVPVEAVLLEQVLDFPGNEVPEPREQWRFFHLFGCALRNGASSQAVQ